MRLSILLSILVLLAPFNAAGENAEFDLTFSQSGNYEILIADSFKTIKRSSVTTGQILELEREVDRLNSEVNALRRTVEEMDRRLKAVER